MISTDVEELSNLFELNRLEDCEELGEVLEVVEKGIQRARKKAKSTKAVKKWWGEKMNKGESELISKLIIASTNDAGKVEKVVRQVVRQDSKLLLKVSGSVNDAEKILQKLSDIGFKPTLTSGNKVASESYALLQQGLRGIGNLHYAVVGLSMVAYVLERVNVVKDNSGKCLALLERMYNLGRNMVNAYRYLPENGDLLQSALTEITKGVYFCCNYTKSGVGSRTMKDLSDQFLRASQISGLKIQMSVQEGQTSLSYQMATLSKQFQTVTIQANQLCSPVALLGVQTSLSTSMTESQLLGNPVMNSVEAEHTINIEHGLAMSSALETEYSKVVIADRSSVSRSEKGRVDKETSVQNAHRENFQHLPQHVTDMHIEEADIVSKLETVTTLGLVGMGGLGKTTRAKAVFNILGPKFDYTCFVSEVKLIRGREDDVKKELWKCLHFGGRKVGGECNLSVLRGKRLLLALDDVSDRDINVLLHIAKDADPASRFIWTSRDCDILKDVGAIHQVYFLAENHARLLFMKHAFPESTMPNMELEGVVGDIVRKCDGLPLALEVLGKYLRGKEKQEIWKDTLALLEKAEKVTNLNQRLWAKLRLSFQSLAETELEIFLDATNFFCGTGRWRWRCPWTLGQARMAWRSAYGEVSELLWQTLIDMSLVYDVGEHERIKVHEQLRSVGRMIASEPEHQGKYQIWECKEDGELKLIGTSDALGGKEVRALQVVSNSNKHIRVRSSSTAFRNLRNLRFLVIDGRIQIVGATTSASQLPTQLVLLQCPGQVLFNPALQKDLAILKLIEMEYVPSSIGQLSKLIHLEIQWSGEKCHSLPESFGHLLGLQNLTFSWCLGLRSLPQTFGQLSALRDLSFYDCEGLQSLPESFGELRALRFLVFSCCGSLKSLCESFGQLRALEDLQLDLCPSLRRLPESFGQLSSLRILGLQRCDSLKLLPQSFGLLSSLERLEFVSCPIQSLPESFGQLSALTRLSLSSCPIKSVPASFGKLSALTRLSFPSCPTESVPASFEAIPRTNPHCIKCLAWRKLEAGRKFLACTQKPVDKSPMVELWFSLRGTARSIGHSTESPISAIMGLFCHDHSGLHQELAVIALCRDH